MATTQGSSIIPTDFNNLKARVKAEMARRKENGSLVAYAGTLYDYSTPPSTGVRINEEHIDKIRDLMALVNTNNIPGAKSQGDPITEIVLLEAKITTLESQPINSKSNDCNAACTGVCITTCSSGCTTTCTGSCSGCSGSCSGGCTSCSGCGGDCGTSCAGCAATCGTNCGGGCSGCSGCSGCGWGCAVFCASSCTTGNK